MFAKLNRKIQSYTSAFRAGWIADSCQRKGGACRFDDINEEIIPCWLHRAKIARLGMINTQATEPPKKLSPEDAAWVRKNWPRG